MKKYFLYIVLYLCFLSAFKVQAQLYTPVIIGAEYYWGTTDPGAGNGTSINALDGNYNSAIEAALRSNVNIPSAGLNLLNVRFQENNGAWGSVFSSVVNLDASFTADAKITQGEYYIDTDNGAGNNQAMVAIDGNFNSIIEGAIRSGISAPGVGLHIVGVRFKALDGTWGPDFKLAFQIDAQLTATFNIEAGEYFFDTDPGVGNATPLFAVDGNYNNVIETAVRNGVSALSPGLHTITARFKDNNGAWGPAFSLVFMVDNQFSFSFNVIAGEYFFDTDPGVGNAVPIAAADGNFNNAVENAISSAATGGLTQGNHILSVRVKGIDGTWGPVFSLLVIIDPCSPAPTATISSTGATTICPNDSVVLNANTGSGLTYQWMKDGVNIGGANTAQYAAKQTGAYTVAITNTGGCTTVSNTINVTVAGTGTADITISVLPAGSICSGTSVTFTAQAVNGGATPVYQWKVNGINAGTNSATFTSSSLSNNDKVSCILTSSAVCIFPVTDTSNIITMAVTAAPVNTVSASGTTTLCTGQTVTLSALPGYATYNWSNGATTQSISVNTAANYSVVIGNANGCSATSAPVSVTVNALPTAAISPANVSVCNGKSTSLTASGGTSYVWSNSLGTAATVSVAPVAATTYTVTVTNANGCSATASRTVNVTATSTGVLNASICQGQSYLFNGANRTTQGVYLDTLINAAGCDSFVTLNLTVNALPVAVISPATVNICSGSSALLTASGGTSYAWSNSLGNNAAVTVSPAANTTYSVTVTNAGNCSAAASRTVTVSTFNTGIINASICQGQSYFFNGANRTTQGVYLDTLTSVNGCDSILTLNLVVNNHVQSSVAATICQGAVYNFNGTGLTQQGIYTATLQSAAGCDSVVQLTLTVSTSLQSSVSVNICQGAAYSFNGLNLTQGGIYRDTLISTSGCDSIVVLNLSVSNIIQSSVNAGVCSGGAYNFNGVNLTQAGIYRDTLQTTLGCDSVVVLNLTLNNALQSSVNAAICLGSAYNFNGINLTQAGIYRDTLQTTSGCDSVVVLILTTGNAVTANINVAICQGSSYNFRGISISQAGVYRDTLQTVSGCDSIVTLNLAINDLPQPVIVQNGNTLSTTQTYNSYQWQLGGIDIGGAQSQTYLCTQDGFYTVVVTDANFCEGVSSSLQVLVSGIDNAVSTLSVNVYPNPFEQHFVIETDVEQPLTYTVYDIAGKVLAQEPFTAKAVVNMNHFAVGSYMVAVAAGNNTIKRFKIVKQ